MSQAQRKEFSGPSKAQSMNIRCNLPTFTKIVDESNLASHPELYDCPFRFLLKLKGYKLDIDLIEQLVAKFDVHDKSLMLNDNPVVLTEEDFKVILKIENKDPTKTERDPTDFKENLFLKRHNTGKVVVCNEAVKGMLENPDTMDNFKRAFVLLCLRYVICAPANGKLGKKMLKYVKHADDLKNQQWAKLAMDCLVDGIRSYKDSKANIKNLGGSMVFLELFYNNKLTNKTPENLISEGVKSPQRFDDEIMSENEVSEIKMTAQMYHAWDTLKNLKINYYKHLKIEDMEIDEDMEGEEEEEEEDEDNKIDEEMDIDEGVDVMHTTVGPFRIRHNILTIGECELLSTSFKNGGDSMRVVCVDDADGFAVSKGDFWETLSPKQHMSNVLINHVTEVLNIRQIRNGTIERWYFPTDNRSFRIYSSRSEKSKVKYYITKQNLLSVNQIFFPVVEDKHCYMFVFDNPKKQLQIWDSMERGGVKEYEQETTNLCRFLVNVTQVKEFNNYIPTMAGVPQQTNTYDCGIYVCRSMEYPDEVMQFHKHKWIRHEQRCLLAFRILTAAENTHNISCKGSASQSNQN